MVFLNAFSQMFTAGFLADFWKLVIGDWFGFIANYGWRVVVFTICLKLILSPLDFFNRKKSFDNKRLMRRMKPEMDRIEKQYANNQQELMMRKRALQKKYGYGMGMTCLTSILTMIIFISVWNGFREVSTQMQIAEYNDMLAYHRTQQQAIYLDPQTLITEDAEGVSVTSAFWDSFVADYKNGKVSNAGDKSFAKRKAALKNELSTANPDLTKDQLNEMVNTQAEQNLAAWATECFVTTMGYTFNDTATAADYSALFVTDWTNYCTTYKTLKDYKTKASAYEKELKASSPDLTKEEIAVAVEGKVSEWAQEYYLAQYELVYGTATTFDATAPIANVYNGLLNVAQSGALTQQLAALVDFHTTDDMVAYYENSVKESWLWVKNIWRADTWTNPIPTHSEYQNTAGVTVNAAEYKTVMSGVSKKYASTWNGYLIMIILVVGLNFLNQWLAMRLQKASGEAQMSGAGNSMKIMLFMMPLMMAVFAFTMASAFTIYMATNALMTLAITGITTLILTLREKRLDRLEDQGVVIKSWAEKRAERKALASGTTRQKTSNPAHTARPSYDRRNIKKQ